VRLVSSCRVLRLACATMELDRIDDEVYLKECGENSVLALYSDVDIRSFKDEKRLCQRSLVCERANVWKV
jgi:hypothetical protein